MKDSGEFTCTKTQSHERVWHVLRMLRTSLQLHLRLEEGGERGRREAGDGVRKVDGCDCARSCLCDVKMFRSSSVHKQDCRDFYKGVWMQDLIVENGYKVKRLERWQSNGRLPKQSEERLKQGSGGEDQIEETILR